MFGIEEVVSYRTSDGRIFDDEAEATIHEIDLNLTSFEGKDDLILRDDMGESVSLHRGMQAFDEVFFVKCKTQEAVELVHLMAKQVEVASIPDHPGTYRWDNDFEEWLELNEEFEELAKKWKKFLPLFDYEIFVSPNNFK